MNSKKNTAFIIITLSLILVILCATGIMFVVNKFENNQQDKTKDKICDISLKYIPISDYSYTEDISLSDAETKELNGILNKMEFSESEDNVNEPKYIIKYCDTELIIGSNDKIIKNNEKSKIIKDYNLLSDYLKQQENKINKVYLHEMFDEYIPTELSSKKHIELKEEDKNKIRDLWNKQEKNIEYLELLIEEGYKLIIDDDTLVISLYEQYASYKGGYILLDQEILNIIREYIKEDIKYEINNDLSYYDNKYSRRGVTYDTLNTLNAPSYYFISSGQKNTGGYTISIKEVNIDNQGNVEVIINETSPSPEGVTTQALTYPVCSIKFDTQPISIIFKTETGEILKPLNY